MASPRLELSVAFLESTYKRVQANDPASAPLREFYKKIAAMHPKCVGYIEFEGYTVTRIHITIPDYPVSLGSIRVQAVRRGLSSEFKWAYTVESQNIKTGAHGDRHFTQNIDIKKALKNASKYLYRQDMGTLSNCVRGDVNSGARHRGHSMASQINETLGEMFPTFGRPYGDPLSTRYNDTFTLLNELVVAGFKSSLHGFEDKARKVLDMRTTLRTLKNSKEANMDMFLVTFDDILADGTRAFLYPMSLDNNRWGVAEAYASAQGYNHLTGKEVTINSMPDDIATKVSSLMLVESKAYIEGVGYKVSRNMFVVHAGASYLEG